MKSLINIEEFTPVGIDYYSDKYLINKRGEVYSCKTKKIISSVKDKDGYPRVILAKEYKNKCISIHRLLGYTFLGLEDHLVINHKNGIKDDNRLENLEVCTIKENSIHAHKTGLIKRKIGEDKNTCKISFSNVIEIRELYKTGKYSMRKLASQFNTTSSNICLIVNFKSRISA